MKQNMGFIDRLIRVLVAVAIVAFYLTGQISGIAAIILGVLALVFVLTSIIGFCPLYLPVRISTKKK